MVFVATDKMPGVYIDEIQLPGPIPGIATNNVAIIGPAEKGPTNKPVLVTNPTQFTKKFGGYITSPKLIYATHAVDGFFANGGTKCYFVRIGLGSPAYLTLLDQSGNATASPPILSRPTLTVTAKQDGAAGSNPTVTVSPFSIAATQVPVVSLTGSGATGNFAIVDNSSDLLPGDTVTVQDATNREQVIIDRVDVAKPTSGATTTKITTIFFKTNLQNSYATGTVHIGLVPGQTRIRVTNVSGIEPGSYVHIKLGTSTTEEDQVVASVNKFLRTITLENVLKNNYVWTAGSPIAVQTSEFSLTLGPEAPTVLSMDPRHSRYFAKAFSSNFVELSAPSDPPNPSVPPHNLPDAISLQPLQNGSDDNINLHTDAHYEAGIDSLEIVDEVNMLCVPDNTAQNIQSYLIAHCEKMQDRFAILDFHRINANPTDDTDLDDVRKQRDSLQSDRGYGALYYPRIKIRDPNPNFDRTITIPASGHIAGVYARTDEQKGVHKVPANEVLNGVLELERTLTATDAGLLNEQSINVLQFFRGRGFRIWGGRTLATSTQWRFINVRRLMLFIEESIQEACEAFVFDPNNLSLWETIKRQVNGFLTQVWQTGALFGATPKQAFRVRIDEELNPPETRALGQLYIEVIVFPTTPAEFIVFRVIQEPGGPRLVEL